MQKPYRSPLEAEVKVKQCNSLLDKVLPTLVMGVVLTTYCLLFLLASCGTIQWAYSEAQWTAHTIHFQENMDMPNCQWCIDYNHPIP